MEHFKPTQLLRLYALTSAEGLISKGYKGHEDTRASRGNHAEGSCSIDSSYSTDIPKYSGTRWTAPT